MSVDTTRHLYLRPCHIFVRYQKQSRSRCVCVLHMWNVFKNGYWPRASYGRGVRGFKSSPRAGERFSPQKFLKSIDFKKKHSSPQRISTALVLLAAVTVRNLTRTTQAHATSFYSRLSITTTIFGSSPLLLSAQLVLLLQLQPRFSTIVLHMPPSTRAKKNGSLQFQRVILEPQRLH